MRIFGAICSGASSVVQRAIHIPSHRILALKKINIFEFTGRYPKIVEKYTRTSSFIYASEAPDGNNISFRCSYSFLNEKGCRWPMYMLHHFKLTPQLVSFYKGLSYLHGVRHLVHRDIKPAILLVNLKGEPKIIDFGISAGLDNSMAMCATFVGTVTYMSPERIRNESYSYPADIWSLGLALFECCTGEFPYTANEGLVNLMLQKDADARPTAEQVNYISGTNLPYMSIFISGTT
ncbi:hypothetical protein REPUB_Repub09cG0023700 [Reevesia pubescens]